jgi:beta-aspartyl-peptidase (threonine type)
VRALEDDPTFDAAVGSVLNLDGVVELDAAIMDGETLRSGAVAAVRRIRNPITLARRVLESQVILLAGVGAERFAEAAGVSLCDPAELIVERERERWAALLKQGDFRTQDAFGARQGDQEARRPGDQVIGQESPDHSVSLSPDSPRSNPGDTVGAVALDREGHLAAGTSTGGTANKLPGRVGDSPLIGCGLYADDQSGGCSSTGWGESIIKVLLAKTAIDRISAGRAPMEAAQEAIEILARRVDGFGGCIMLDAHGRVGFAFNTPHMAYAYRTAEGPVVVGI